MRSSSLLFLLLAPALLASQELAHTDMLYVPENLKPNVAFWEITYQNISSDQGLMHDMDSLRVIYDTIRADSLSGRSRTRMIRDEERRIGSLLRGMAASVPSEWDSSMQRIAACWGRALSPDELIAASNRVRFQLGQRDRFIRGLERSGRYLNRIIQIFQEYALPPELAYLPHVESSFNYKAYSKVGAAGIWQFMRSTGRLYMKVSYVIDERLDPIKSTHAAAKLLKSNYLRLNAWPLAVTAYNHGTGSMEAAISQCGTTDIGVIVDRYKARTFQFASKNFYPAFVAAYRSALNYIAIYGDVQMEPPFDFYEHRLDKYYRPSALAGMAGLSQNALQEYNLSIRPAVFRSDQYLPKDFVIKLPVSLSFANLDSLLAAVPADQARDTLPPETFHRVRPGENLSTISRMYGVNLSAMLNLNSLSLRSSIYPGQMLVLPGGGAPVSPIAAAPPGGGASVSPVAAAPPARAPSVSLDFLIAGKTLTAASPTAELIDSLPALWDFMYPSLVALSSGTGTRECEFCEFNADFYVLDFVRKLPRAIVIKVQIDETVGHYAEWAGVPASEIRWLNRISSTIHLGQDIEIPVSGEKAEAFLAQRIEYHMGIEEDFFNNYDVTGMDTLKLKRGATLWSLCLEREMPLWLVIKANPEIGSGLQLTGLTRILMPVVEEKKAGQP